LVLVTFGTGLLLAFLACLPDLNAISASEFSSCGDGIIDYDAGEHCDPGNDGGAVIGCKACQIVCENEGWIDPTTGHCYYLNLMEKVFDTATQHCEMNNAHLVTYASATEVEAVKTGLALSVGTWVGLSFSSSSGSRGTRTYLPPRNDPPVQEPGWVAPNGQCPGCFANIPAADMDIPPFTTNSPMANCVASPKPPLATPVDDQNWVLINCTTNAALAAVCEREPVGTSASPCNGGICINVAKTVGQKHYFYVSDPATARDAQAFCLALKTGAQLAVFATP
jgi:hypothetical protein